MRRRTASRGRISVGGDITSQYLDIAERALSKTRRPMSAREIVDWAQDNGMLSDRLAGKTPWQTTKSKLSVEIRRLGDASRFVRTAPGRFRLRSQVDPAAVYAAPPLRPQEPTERVLAFDSRTLDRVTDWQGIRRDHSRVGREILRLPCSYLPRLEAEADDRYTQVLTYVMVFRGGSMLRYRRGTYNRVEKYLRGALCVGFGGHVAESDLTLFNRRNLGIMDSAARELAEEIILPKADLLRLSRGEGLRVVGILNDDSSDVGRRHIAFVLRYDVSPDRYWREPRRGERSITQLAWIPENAPQDAGIWDFEYWSQLCLRHFAPTAVRRGPAWRVVRKAALRPPHVLCILGPVGCGKTQAANCLRTALGYKEVNSGKIVAELLGVPPVPATPRARFQEMALRMIRAPGGPGKLARQILRRADRLGERVMVDGVRQAETLRELREVGGGRGIGLIFVQTPADLAYRFFHEREGGTMTDFLSARGAEVESEVEGFISHADAVLYNWVGAHELRRAVAGLMSDAGVHPVTRSVG